MAADDRATSGRPGSPQPATRSSRSTGRGAHPAPPPPPPPPSPPPDDDPTAPPSHPPTPTPPGSSREELSPNYATAPRHSHLLRPPYLNTLLPGIGPAQPGPPPASLRLGARLRAVVDGTRAFLEEAAVAARGARRRSPARIEPRDLLGAFAPRSRPAGPSICSRSSSVTAMPPPPAPSAGVACGPRARASRRRRRGRRGTSGGRPCPGGSCGSSRRRTCARPIGAPSRRRPAPRLDERGGFREAVVGEEPGRSSTTSGLHPSAAAAPHERDRVVAGAHDQQRSGGSSTSTNARTSPGSGPDLGVAAPRAARFAASTAASSTAAITERSFARAVGFHDDPGDRSDRRRAGDSSTVTRLIGSFLFERHPQGTRDLGRAIRRFDEDLDRAVAAEPEPPHLVVVGREVPAGQASPAFLHDDAGHVGDVTLEAATADVADRSAVLGDQQPGAGPPVRGSADGDDRGERHPFALGGQGLDRLEDVADLATPAMVRESPRTGETGR